MIYRMIRRGDLSDHAPPLVKKNASRHWTDILTGQGRLRESRKGARAPAIFAGCTPIHLAIGKKAFAGVPQVSRKTFWCLREPRKCLEKLFGVCGSPANVSIWGKRSFLGRGVCRCAPTDAPQGRIRVSRVQTPFERHFKRQSNLPPMGSLGGGVCCCAPTA